MFLNRLPNKWVCYNNPIIKYIIVGSMQTRIVQINEYFFNVFREGYGLPVVLLHDWGTSWHHWEPLIPKLTEAGYAVYAPDLLGHGKSAHPQDPEFYYIDNYYQCIASWMRAEGLEKPFLIGHSLGAYLSINYAIDNPKAVPGMVLINPLVMPQQINQLIIYKSQLLSLMAELYIRYAPKPLMELMFKLFRYHKSELPPALIHQMALDYKQTSPYIIRALAGLRDIRSLLDKIDIPTLVMWGDNDATLKPELYPEIVTRLSQSQGHCIPGGEHSPHLIRSEECIELLLPFVDKILLGDPDIQF